MQFWDSGTAVAQCMLQGHKNSGKDCSGARRALTDTNTVISINLNPAGNLLATGSGDNLARICAYISILVMILGSLDLRFRELLFGLDLFFYLVLSLSCYVLLLFLRYIPISS